MRHRLLMLLLVVAVSYGRAQDTLAVTDGFRMQQEWTGKKLVAAGLAGGILAGSLVSSYYDWWDGEGRPFHLLWDGFLHNDTRGIDKFGHSFTSYFYFHAFRDMMLWGGFSPRTAYWWSFGMAAFFAVSIEIGDGFSPYGFSFEDLGANAIGLGYAMLQTEYPFLQNIGLKWSFVPDGGYRFPPHFVNYYDGHTYWVTFNMHNLLPEPVGQHWPEWLQLAVGYSVADQLTRRELVIGLDFNLRALSTSQPDLLLLRNTADMIHLPAPALKITEEKQPRWYLFHLN